MAASEQAGMNTSRGRADAECRMPNAEPEAWVAEGGVGVVAPPVEGKLQWSKRSDHRARIILFFLVCFDVRTGQDRLDIGGKGTVYITLTAPGSTEVPNLEKFALLFAQFYFHAVDIAAVVNNNKVTSAGSLTGFKVKRRQDDPIRFWLLVKQ